MSRQFYFSRLSLSLKVIQLIISIRRITLRKEVKNHQLQLRSLKNRLNNPQIIWRFFVNFNSLVLHLLGGPSKVDIIKFRDKV